MRRNPFHVPSPENADPASIRIFMEAGNHRRRQKQLNNEWLRLPGKRKAQAITEWKEIANERYPRKV